MTSDRMVGATLASQNPEMRSLPTSFGGAHTFLSTAISSFVDRLAPAPPDREAPVVFGSNNA